MGKYWGLAIKMVAAILLLTLGGVWLDDQINLAFPIFTVLLSLGGAALAIYILVVDTRPPKK